MTLHSRWIVSLLLTLAAGRLTAAGLEWPKTELQLAAEPGRNSVITSFPFRNAGDQPVRILSLQASCDCTAAEVSKEAWAPGESGEVRVVFTIGGRTGLQDKIVTVTTDDVSAKPVVLRLLVEIPADASVRPRALFWAAGSKADEKIAEVVVPHATPATTAEVQCSDERFQTRLEREPQSGTWRLHVRPVDGSQPGQATIRVTVTLNGHPQVFVLYAAVR